MRTERWFEGPTRPYTRTKLARYDGHEVFDLQGHGQDEVQLAMVLLLLD